MPSDGSGTLPFAGTIADLASGLRSLAAPRVGGALLLLAAGLGSVAVTYPAVSPLQAAVVGVGAWLVVRTVTPDAEPARRSNPLLTTCIDCGRTVAASPDTPVRCVDCADVADGRNAQSAQATRNASTGNVSTGGTGRTARAARATSTGRTAGAGANASTATASAAGAGTATGTTSEATQSTADAATATDETCDRCGGTGPFDRVRLLDGEDYDYCGDCRAEAEDADVVHTVAMSRERAYEVLGLSAGADDAAVRAAFRERAKATHPDRDGDRNRFDRVREAYERLSE